MPLKVIKRHGSPFWYLRGSVRGVNVDESTKVADREQAESIRAKREWEIVNRQLGGSRAVATFLEAAVSYMENGGEARFVQPLLNHFMTTPLSQIGQAEVEACARKIYPGLAPATINRKVFTPISAIMMHAAKRKLCDKPALERPKQPRGRVRWITFEEAGKLIGCCAPHLAPLVTFMLFTGCRIGEALALDWRDVDLSRSHAAFLDTKNGDRRGAPLHPRAFAALANLPHRTGMVFRRPDKQPYAPKDDGGGQIKTAFKAACRRAGISNFHPHDCRHTWATWHYSANRDTAH
jgi:site-specific recombinase XerC